MSLGEDSGKLLSGAFLQERLTGVVFGQQMLKWNFIDPLSLVQQQQSFESGRFSN